MTMATVKTIFGTKPLYTAILAAYGLEPYVPRGAWARWVGDRHYGHVEVRFV